MDNRLYRAILRSCGWLCCFFAEEIQNLAERSHRVHSPLYRAGWRLYDR